MWILEAKQDVETCEVSFDETMPCTTPGFEISGDDEEGTPIFEDEEGVVDVGDAGVTAPAAAPAPSATSSDDEGGPLPTASSSLPRQQAQAEVGPTKDTGEVTSEIVPSRQVQRDHPPHRMIGDIHQRVTRSSEQSEIGSPGFLSKEGIDYEETFALVARLEAIRILLAFAASKGFKLQQMDVKSAFPNGFIEEEVYVRQPPGFESVGFPTGLKSFLLKSGFVMGSVDKTLFLLSHGGDTSIVRIYVDDIIFGGSSHAWMSREFEMSLMGELQFFLGLQIKQVQTRHLMPMKMGRRWTEGISRDDRLTSYLTATGPDIRFAVRLCACYRASPRNSHHQAVKRIFRYSKFTPELGLWYSSGSSLFVRGFSDADHAGCRIDRKSTSGTCQLLGTSLVSWSSRKQASVSLSTTERVHTRR
ncbi:hypothetical protein U9M48_003595 [Paspalum notatum var. saurae]|uniref:Reverse transcriptase Ty1/copia-type domain-containing protein n=1 Tax=Paspalum notatum var. saurae TaxID=547442 RepID=A0AAQ3SIB1_PASNO